MVVCACMCVFESGPEASSSGSLSISFETRSLIDLGRTGRLDWLLSDPRRPRGVLSTYPELRLQVCTTRSGSSACVLRIEFRSYRVLAKQA